MTMEKPFSMHRMQVSSFSAWSSMRYRGMGEVITAARYISRTKWMPK